MKTMMMLGRCISTPGPLSKLWHGQYTRAMTTGVSRHRATLTPATVMAAGRGQIKSWSSRTTQNLKTFGTMELEPARRGQTLVELVQFWSERDPEYPALIFWSSEGRQVMTRKDVLDLSSKFAYRLNNHGVQPGDVVCISLPNCPQRVVAEFGIHMAGAVSLNGESLRSDGEDLISTFLKSNTSALIVNPNDPVGAWQLTKHAFARFKTHKNYTDVHSDRVPSLKKVFNVGYSGSINDLLKSVENEEQYVYHQGSANETCSIFTTSGTTGYSKLVPHSDTNILSTYFAFSQAIGSHSAFTLFDSGSFGWVGSFPAFYLYSGGTQVAIDDSRDNSVDRAALIWEVIRKEKIKYGLIFPSTMQKVCEAKRKDFKHGHEHQMTTIMTGGQPITRENMSAIGNLTEAVAPHYGLTETICVGGTYFNSENLSEFKNGMVGFPFKGVTVQIVDNSLNPVPPLTRGEVLVQSSSLTSGYVQAGPKAGDSFLPDGWFRTGDIGYQTEDGCLFVEGRGFDAINHGDDILYPTWLEEILIECPGVKDVVIVPIPDKIVHQDICACVRVDEEADIKPSVDDIIHFCQMSVISHPSFENFIPKYVLFFDEFPKTKTDKLDRRGLAAMAKQRLSI